MITDQDLLYQMLSESRLDLMYLPAGVVAWLFDRPEPQIDAASKLGIAAKDLNPITQGSLLRADQNVLILKTDSGHTFRIYPDGGYSYDGQPTNIDGCVDALHDIPDHESCGCGCGGAGTCGEPAQSAPEAPEEDGNMAVMMAPDARGIPQEEILAALQRSLMNKANDMDEGSYGAGTIPGPYMTYDELASSAAQDVETESMPTEDAGSSDMSGGPIGTDMFDVEDDIAQFLGMGTDPDVDGTEAEHEEVMREARGEDSGSSTVSIELTAPYEYNGNGSDYTEAELEVYYDIQPTELEGGHVFWQGGIEVTEIQIATDFEFMGNIYKAGTKFPAGLLKFWEPPRGSEGQDRARALNSYIEMMLDGKVEIPTKGYPMTR